jgi:Periplasmic binding protein-like domain
MFSLEGGQAAATRLLRAGVTGIICASDVLALGAIRAVRRAGLDVPGDVSVVGFDDSGWLNCTDPPLTTVRQPIRELGERACERLFERIAEPSLRPKVELLPIELVLRSSCGCPPGTAVRQPVTPLQPPKCAPAHVPKKATPRPPAHSPDKPSHSPDKEPPHSPDNER